jgi:6-pyruvoyltetrahydropterin/6-carboxytetrahydropterin synthase
MGMTNVRITRRATFAAGHILCRPEWDEARNREVFGACVNEHGHNYVVEVTVGGPVDAETGMVVNLKHVDAVLRREFIDAVDHRHLNHDVDFLRGVIPTAENVALAAFHRLEPHLKPARLLKVRVVESENNAAEVSAE